MDAFLLSAGLGTRLRPLTDHKPKPLIEISGKPLIAWNLEALSKIGCKKVIVNASYLAEQLIEFVGDGSKWNLEVLFSFEEELLDTGGGLKKALPFISSETFITWNSDVFIDPSFATSPEGLLGLLARHEKSPTPVATLLVRDEKLENVEAYGKLIVDQENKLVDFLGKRYLNSEGKETKTMFSGITLMSKDIERYFPDDKKIFSLTRDIFPSILSDNRTGNDAKIRVSYCNCYWNDVGTPERLAEASNYMK